MPVPAASPPLESVVVMLTTAGSTLSAMAATSVDPPVDCCERERSGCDARPADGDEEDVASCSPMPTPMLAIRPMTSATTKRDERRRGGGPAGGPAGRPYCGGAGGRGGTPGGAGGSCRGGGGAAPQPTGTGGAAWDGTGYCPGPDPPAEGPASLSFHMPWFSLDHRAGRDGGSLIPHLDDPNLRAGCSPVRDRARGACSVLINVLRSGLVPRRRSQAESALSNRAGTARRGRARREFALIVEEAVRRRRAARPVAAPSGSPSATRGPEAEGGAAGTARRARRPRSHLRGAPSAAPMHAC